MRDLGSNWTYSVTQKIAQNATEPYDSFVFRDEIEECMKINSVKVINDQGNDVSGWFDITTTANHVVASLKDPKNNKDFYKKRSVYHGNQCADGYSYQCNGRTDADIERNLGKTWSLL